MTRKPGEPIDVKRFLLALFSDVVADFRFERRFKSGHRDLHRFFWLLSREESTRPFVSQLLFDVNGNYPHSLQLDELFQELQLSGLLARPNPTYRYNDICFTTRSYADELQKELSPEEKDAYEKILHAFENELCVKRTK